jgi:hypothetical protein
MASEERTREFLERRRAWPMYPILPMKRIPGDGTGEFGRISAADTAGGVITIHREDGTAAVFPSIDALIAAGWRVD